MADVDWDSAHLFIHPGYRYKYIVTNKGVYYGKHPSKELILFNCFKIGKTFKAVFDEKSKIIYVMTPERLIEVKLIKADVLDDKDFEGPLPADLKDYTSISIFQGTLILFMLKSTTIVLSILKPEDKDSKDK